MLAVRDLGLCIGYLSALNHVVDDGVVFCAEHHLRRASRCRWPELVNPRVAYVGYRGTLCVEFQQCHRRSHLLHFVRVVLLCERLKSLVNSMMNHRVVKSALDGGFLQQCLAHGLADYTARHLATVVASHTVADDEETLVGMRAAVIVAPVTLGLVIMAGVNEGREETVFLVPAQAYVLHGVCVDNIVHGLLVIVGLVGNNQIPLQIYIFSVRLARNQLIIITVW